MKRSISVSDDPAKRAKANGSQSTSSYFHSPGGNGKSSPSTQSPVGSQAPPKMKQMTLSFGPIKQKPAVAPPPPVAKGSNAGDDLDWGELDHMTAEQVDQIEAEALKTAPASANPKAASMMAVDGDDIEEVVELSPPATAYTPARQTMSQKPGTQLSTPPFAKQPPASNNNTSIPFKPLGPRPAASPSPIKTQQNQTITTPPKAPSTPLMQKPSVTPKATPITPPKPAPTAPAFTPSTPKPIATPTATTPKSTVTPFKTATKFPLSAAATSTAASFASTPTAGTPSSDDPARWEWLKNPRDAQKRSPDDPDYDPTTLYIDPRTFDKLSATRQQYWEFKRKHYDVITFFQVGDFFELFENDADIGERDFGLHMTHRPNMRSVGVNSREVEKWAQRVAEYGYKVAIMRQEGKKKDGANMDRVLEMVITPGTRLWSPHMSVQEALYLVAVTEIAMEHSKEISKTSKLFGVCLLHASTGEFLLGQFVDDDRMTLLETMLVSIRPKEVLYRTDKLSSKAVSLLKRTCGQPMLTPIRADEQTSNWEPRPSEFLSEYFGSERNEWPETLRELFGAEKEQAADVRLEAMWSAAYLCFSYLKKYNLDQAVITQRNFQRYQAEDTRENRVPYMILDGVTLQNLEVLENASGREDGTLYKLLCYAVTNYGKRNFRRWLMHPLRTVNEIENRLDAVNELQSYDAFNKLREDLVKFSRCDLERIISYFHSSPTRVQSSTFIQALQEFSNILRFIQSLEGQFKCKFLRDLTTIGEGGVFPDISSDLQYWRELFDWKKSDGTLAPNPGFDESFDAANQAVEDAKTALDNALSNIVRVTGNKAAKYNKNRVIEMAISFKKAVEKVPNRIDLDGTASLIRFTTPEIQQLVEDLNEAQTKLNEVSSSLLQTYLRKFDENYSQWRQAVFCIAEIDCIVSLAFFVQRTAGSTCRPVFVESKKPLMLFEDLRHPTLELVKNDAVIPNTIQLGGEEAAPVILLTGPNMGGKSTLLRAACLATIIAQIGCYVPASKCELSPVDRIFTRIGAKDNIFADASTFMVELQETNLILQRATPHSLVILDELGRGTSTHDGYAIAYAVLRYLAENVGARVLFSTHHHKLTEEFQSHHSIAPFHMECKVLESEQKVIALYKMAPGVCPKSYGMSVAIAAGIPADIVSTAANIAEEFFHSLQQKERSRLSASTTTKLQQLIRDKVRTPQELSGQLLATQRGYTEAIKKLD